MFDWTDCIYAQDKNLCNKSPEMKLPTQLFQQKIKMPEEANIDLKNKLKENLRAVCCNQATQKVKLK